MGKVVSPDQLQLGLLHLPFWTSSLIGGASQFREKQRRVGIYVYTPYYGQSGKKEIGDNLMINKEIHLQFEIFSYFL